MATFWREFGRVLAWNSQKACGILYPVRRVAKWPASFFCGKLPRGKEALPNVPRFSLP